MRARFRFGLPVLVALGCGDDASRATGGLTFGSGDTGIDSADAGETGDPGDGGSSSGDSGPDSGGDGPSDPCDGFDNDADGMVDEGCTCMVGSVQDCFAGPPEAVLACRTTTQVCEETQSEYPGSWGACAGLCDGSTLTLDDVAMLRIDGAAAGDGFTLAATAGFADLNGDGELDFIGASSRGDAAEVDVGAGYAFYGGPCLQGATIDLASTMLAGNLDDDLRGGFVIDDASGRDQAPRAMLADIDGDGFGDAVVGDSGHTLGLVYGADTMQALYDLETADGTAMVRLTGGGGTGGGFGGHTAFDFDADGLAEVFMSAQNYGFPDCPCGSQGVDIWWGRDPFAASTPLDTTIAIGIGTVGMASQHNFTAVGGWGDFDNDGYLDLAAGNGAANDGYVIAYRAYAFFGNADRVVPGSMPGVSGSDGFGLGGGTGLGPLPNHQHGDFDGDGIDDFIAYGSIPYHTALEIDVVFGGGPFPASLGVADLQPGVGATLTSATTAFAGGPHMGVGDVDADGHDDIVIGSSDEEVGGVLVVWGRPTAGGPIDVDADPEVTLVAGASGLGLTDAIAIADIDGDGLGDLLVGAPRADTSNGTDSGAGLVKFGSCLAHEHNPTLLRGQDGGDTLIGTGDRDTIAAGRGDDTIEGGGGDDAIYGGHGDDRIVVPDLAFTRIHGGVGLDTLVLEGAGMLDLRTTGRARIQEIERFELGEGAQTLAMNQGDATGLSGSSNRIEVDGDAMDVVVLDGAWTSAGAAGGFVEYRSGTLVVAVREAVDVQLQ
jgi:hypothetical protein